jgi:hypothetical protein
LFAVCARFVKIGLYRCTITAIKIIEKIIKKNRIHKKLACTVETGISLSAVVKKRKYQRKER